MIDRHMLITDRVPPLFQDHLKNNAEDKENGHNLTRWRKRFPDASQTNMEHGQTQGWTPAEASLRF
jgi:hypothetical protein